MPRVASGIAAKLIASVGLANLAELTGVAMVDDELTPADVAREFRVSPSTVRRWGDRGWLQPTRRTIGSRQRRYSRADVETFRRRAAAGEFDGLSLSGPTAAEPVPPPAAEE